MGTFLFLVLSLAKTSEGEGDSKGSYLTIVLFSMIGVSLVPLYYFYQGNKVEIVLNENSKKLDALVKDKNETNYLRNDLERERVKYAKLEKEFYALRKSVKEIAPDNEDDILDHANKDLEDNGYESAIFYLKLQLSYLKHVEDNRQIPIDANRVIQTTQKETIEVIEEVKEEENSPISISIESEIKWIKPFDATCTSNGGKVNSNGCQANWEDAKSICSAIGGSLPRIEALRKVVIDCGGEMKDNNLEEKERNKDNKFYQACYEEQGFTIWNWSKTAKNSTSV